MIEPNCDMPWDIYLDWLQDQGNEDLRGIDPHCLITPMIIFPQYHLGMGYGDGIDGWRYQRTIKHYMYGNGTGCADELYRGTGDGWSSWYTHPDGTGRGFGDFFIDYSGDG